ncbi:PAS domain-containing protein [Nannocystis bainbridge]|uniref:PAS domain-containing protein n=1 Tax=Nannocystis bainbridge TaxID=2995303 RepID=A0ABT5DT70_9BACT|nr:PAS domain-containing protein [Nannocystis bainbridge]MDC0715607.1 PAS domain-containing protein [Nannocystis bainbridge]
MDDRSDAGPLVTVEVDAALRITGWNRRAARVFGIDAALAIGRPIAEVLPVAGDPAAWSGALSDVEEPQIRVLERPEGPLHFEAWSQVIRDGDGRVVGATLCGHDVTARQREARRLGVDSRLLAALLENLDLAVWAIDKQANFVLQRGKALQTAGLRPDHFAGQNYFDVYGDLENVEDIRRAIAGEATHALPAEVYGIHWLGWNLPTPSDAELSLISIALDVTASKRTELELRAKLELIERQQDVIRQLSTPIIEVWDGVLSLPIIGLVDTVRTAEIMDNLLQAVTRTRARFAILDLTGVEVVDTGTASHLIRMIQSIRLLGAEGILTGIHPTIAQTIVGLGIDLTHVAVFAKLRDALVYCLGKLRARAKV